VKEIKIPQWCSAVGQRKELTITIFLPIPFIQNPAPKCYVPKWKGNIKSNLLTTKDLFAQDEFKSLLEAKPQLKKI